MSEEQATSAAKARLILAADKQHRMVLCAEEIKAVLEKHGCDLVAAPMLSPDGRIVAQVQVVPKA